jgi:DNA uptake protein ComE-like DNA-binding protein
VTCAAIIGDRPMTDSRPPDVQRRRPVWPLVSLIPLGLGAWAPIYAGARARRALWVALGVLWCLIVIAGFIVNGASRHPDSDDLAGGLLIIGWVGAVATSFSIAPAYRRQLASPLQAATEVGTLRLRDRAQARRLVQTNPQLAAEIGIGRPDRPGATDAGLIDVNNAPATALATLPGVDRGLAQRIVAVREQIDGFTSVEDIGTALDLDGNLVEGLRERAVFLPRAGAA